MGNISPNHKKKLQRLIYSQNFNDVIQGLQLLDSLSQVQEYQLEAAIQRRDWGVHVAGRVAVMSDNLRVFVQLCAALWSSGELC